MRTTDRTDWAARVASGGLALLLAALWLSSFRWYTTIGFDFERRTGPRVITIYDRVRWDAGVCWIGRAEQPREPHGSNLDWWDPGGTLFAPSRPPSSLSLSNQLGFWLIADPSDDPYVPIRYPGATSSRWVGTPGFLPAAFAAWPIWRRRRSKPADPSQKEAYGDAGRAIM